MSRPWWKIADSLAIELERLMDKALETTEYSDKKALSDFLYRNDNAILRIMQEYAKDHEYDDCQ